jgi:Mg/Co/Ni transporter MgtE
MLNTSEQAATFAFRSLTPGEIDLLSTISAISFILGAVAFLCILAATLVVVLKTKLPGRYSIFFSFLLLSAWWSLEQFMGGSLEMTFGPEALLVTAIIYSIIAVLFSFA